MKSILLILFVGFNLITLNGYSQSSTPEKVHSVVDVYRTYEWYTEQNQLWGEILKKQKKNLDAWENYYVSARMAKIMSETDTDRDKWVSKMETIITDMEKAIPGTYEYYHLKSWHSSIWGATEEEVKKFSSWAEKAYAMDPDRTEIYPDMMNVYMINNDEEKMRELSKRWLASGDISPNLIALTYNMLMSTEENAILLTAGDNDTYPALVLQYARDIRPDVTVINIFCAWGSNKYRSNLFSKVKIAITTEINNEMEVVDHVIAHIDENPLYFSYGNYINGAEKLQGKVYNVGLSFRYSDTDFNNTSMLINNYENKFMLDQLQLELYPEPFPEQVKRHNLSYLPGLIQLYSHYNIIGDATKKANTRALILRITSNTNFEETIEETLRKC